MKRLCLTNKEKLKNVKNSSKQYKAKINKKLNLNQLIIKKDSLFQTQI